MLIDDLHYAFRTFLRNSWFTVVAIATLALGMGVNSALFSVVKSVILEDLPYAKPNQLVRCVDPQSQARLRARHLEPAALREWRGAQLPGPVGFTSAV
jgi:hypothetical protein